MKPMRMFKMNGSIIFHTDELIKELEKTLKTEEDKKYLENLLNCEVKECPNTL